MEREQAGGNEGKESAAISHETIARSAGLRFVSHLGPSLRARGRPFNSSVTLEPRLTGATLGSQIPNIGFRIRRVEAPSVFRPSAQAGYT